jgi:hypothetical protein
VISGTVLLLVVNHAELLQENLGNATEAVAVSDFAVEMEADDEGVGCCEKSSSEYVEFRKEAN